MPIFMTGSEPSRWLAIPHTARSNILESPSIFVLAKQGQALQEDQSLP